MHVAASARVVALTLFTSCSETSAAPDVNEWLHAALRPRETTMVIYALDPFGTDVEGVAQRGSSLFHGYEVLASAGVDDSELRAEIASLLAEGIAGAREAAPGCFDPDLGVRVAGPPGELELLVSYRCRLVSRYEDGRFAGSHATGAEVRPHVEALWAAAGCSPAGEPRSLPETASLFEWR